MGLGKTGSSALQTGFVRNRRELAAAGVRYPQHRSDQAARRGKAVSGNGWDLYHFLRMADAEEAAATQGLARVEHKVGTAKEETLLYSSEFLVQFERCRLRELDESMTLRGVEVHAVVYVRNLAGYAVSKYSQLVKRSLLTQTFDEYIGGEPGLQPRLAQLDVLREELGQQRVHVIHYDSVRHRQFADFLERVLGIHDHDGFKDASAEVNRSLTGSELELMRHLNSMLETKAQARIVSDALMERPPLGESTRWITRDQLRVLRERHGDAVARVNERHLREHRLRVDSDDVEVVDEDRADEPSLNERERRVLDSWAATARSLERCQRRNEPTGRTTLTQSTESGTGPTAPQLPPALPRRLLQSVRMRARGQQAGA